MGAVDRRGQHKAQRSRAVSNDSKHTEVSFSTDLGVAEMPLSPDLTIVVPTMAEIQTDHCACTRRNYTLGARGVTI